MGGEVRGRWAEGQGKLRSTSYSLPEGLETPGYGGSDRAFLWFNIPNLSGLWSLRPRNRAAAETCDHSRCELPASLRLTPCGRRSEKPCDFCSGMVASPLAATVVTAILVPLRYQGMSFPLARDESDAGSRGHGSPPQHRPTLRQRVVASGSRIQSLAWPRRSVVVCNLSEELRTIFPLTAFKTAPNSKFVPPIVSEDSSQGD